jgi:hypothetical protein
LASAALRAGTKVRWLAAKVETPTICTSFSTAWRAASSGVANSGPISTSKPRSAKRGGDDLLAAVVPVLTDLGDQNAGAAAFVILELADELLHAFDRVGHLADLSLVDPRNGFDLGAVAPEDLLQRERDLSDSRLGARRIDCELQQIAIAAVGRAGQRTQCFLERLGIAFALEPCEFVDLELAHRRVVDL